MLDEGNLLSWETASEVNISNYELERSSNGTSEWFRIGTIVAQFSLATASHYAWLDETAPNGSSYYRLKVVENNGEARIVSQVVVHERQSSTCSIGTPYPIPASQWIYLDVVSNTDDFMMIQIFDVSGKMKLTEEINVVSGYNKIALDLSGLPVGTYYIITNKNDELKTMRIIKE